jgi:signal transduction histidine kinase
VQENTQREGVRSNLVMLPGRPNPLAEFDEFAFLRGLVQGMRCGVLLIDGNGRLVLLNDPALRILDLRDCPPLGTPLDQALPEHAPLVDAMLDSFGMASLPNRAEMHLESGSRRSKTIGFTLSMVRGNDGRPCGAAMFFKDLTPIEQDEEQQRLKDRLAALGQMAASMAHEIRNPLASIEVSCKLLERRLGPESECRQLLANITGEVKRLNRSVNSCLHYVRPVSLNLGQHELNPMLEEAIRVSESRRGLPGITIRRRLADDLPRFLMDQELLRQVFVNLILNAMEAVGETGHVRIETERVEAPGVASIPYRPSGAAADDPWREVTHLVEIRIADSGPGIDQDVLDKIFHPFFTTKQHGSGVGLAVAKKIVSSHRGSIDVTSAPGEGTEIVVRLPMAAGGGRGLTE